MQFASHSRTKGVRGCQKAPAFFTILLHPMVYARHGRELMSVFAGLPKVRTFLSSEHPDILSRLKTLILYPIVVEDFIQEYKDVEAEAIEQIYVATK